MRRPPAPRIDPDMAPYGLVFRFTRGDGVVVWFEPVPDMDALSGQAMADMVDRHNDIIHTITAPGAPSRMHIFDGDTGECTGEYWFITSPEDT